MPKVAIWSKVAKSCDLVKSCPKKVASCHRNFPRGQNITHFFSEKGSKFIRKVKHVYVVWEDGTFCASQKFIANAIKLFARFCVFKFIYEIISFCFSYCKLPITKKGSKYLLMHCQAWSSKLFLGLSTFLFRFNSCSWSIIESKMATPLQQKEL